MKMLEFGYIIVVFHVIVLYCCLLCYCSSHTVIHKWSKKQFRFIFSTDIYCIFTCSFEQSVSFRSSHSTAEKYPFEHNRVIGKSHIVACLLIKTPLLRARLYLHSLNLWFLPALQKYIEAISTFLKSPWFYSGILRLTMLCLFKWTWLLQ